MNNIKTKYSKITDLKSNNLFENHMFNQEKEFDKIKCKERYKKIKNDLIDEYIIHKEKFKKDEFKTLILDKLEKKEYLYQMPSIMFTRKIENNLSKMMENILIDFNEVKKEKIIESDKYDFKKEKQFYIQQTRNKGKSEISHANKFKLITDENNFKIKLKMNDNIRNNYVNIMNLDELISRKNRESVNLIKTNINNPNFDINDLMNIKVDNNISNVELMREKLSKVKQLKMY